MDGETDITFRYGIATPFQFLPPLGDERRARCCI